MNRDPKSAELRGEVDRRIAAGSAYSAAAGLAEIWRNEAGTAAAGFLLSRYEQLRATLPLTIYRLAIVRSFTVEPAVPLLRAEAFVRGIDLRVHVGDFNAYPQEILDPESSLYRFKPDAMILAARTADLAPELWENYADIAPGAVSEVIQRVSNSFAQWIGAFRERSAATLIVHSLESPTRPGMGVVDAQQSAGQSAAIRQINDQLKKIANEHRGAFVLDYDALVARYGRMRWHDERKWLVARMPIAADHLIYMAREWMRFVGPLSGRIAKVLVADLDNTLWGGVIGEDGMTGIKLGPEYPGAAYRAVQRAMLDLSRRGILLAIASKNNPDDAMEALQRHPGMVLKASDFSAVRISWNDKAQSLREIAAELNVGIDSLAFLDDNPAERQQVRTALPEVLVLDLPDDPLEFASALLDCPAFERLTLSREDAQRTNLYASQRERTQAERSFQSKEDFFHYLDQIAEFFKVSPATVERIAQLTQKTNQFNLTTRRYTEQQISDMAARPEYHVLAIKVRDRFGDQGLVGVAISRDEGGTCEIDTFLLSCRVIGRAVETALLAKVAESARARGCQRLLGRFVATKKNIPARDFYAQHGFQPEAENQSGSTWGLDLRQHTIATPEWIALKTNEGDRI